MVDKAWPGLMRIVEIKQLDAMGRVRHHEQNIYNLLHHDGEEYLLRLAFNGLAINSDYYLGLDNRSLVDASDDMDSLVGEPVVGGGYERQEIDSSTDFVMNFENDHWVAYSPIVAFRAISAAWGPVRNIFLTNKLDDTGFLISTATLASPITLDAGDSVTVRIGMQIKACVQA